MGLLPHPWSLGRLGSLVWTGVGSRQLGRDNPNFNREVYLCDFDPTRYNGQDRKQLIIEAHMNGYRGGSMFTV